jgi:hypothetical protein
MNIKPLQDKAGTKHILIILAASASLGIIFDWLFYGKAVGISFPIFIILLSTAILALSSYFKIRIKLGTYLLLIPTILFSLMVFVRASYTLTPANIIVSFFLIMLMTKSIIGEKIHKFQVTDYLKTLINTPFLYMSKLMDYLKEISGLKKHLPKSNIYIQILRGVMIAIPLLLIFIMLFSSADMIFQQHVLDFLKFDTGEGMFGKTIIFIIVSSILAGLFYYLLKPYFTKKEDTLIKSKLGIVEISVILGLINALFLAFLTVQITYLFGGEKNISIETFTYANYARKGFFELLLVAMLSFLIIWFTDKIAISKYEGHGLAYKILSSLLSIQVLVIMYSSFVRLQLYEEAYGFTELRFYSHAFTIFLGIIFLLLLYKILFDHRENIFAINAFIISILALALINIFNPDAFIAEQNIDRFNRTGKIDVFYLEKLSDDAIPEIIENIDKLDRFVKDYRPSTYVKNILIKRHKKMEESDAYKDWQSFHLSRVTAKQIMEEKLL